jgi:hypothetical protein
MILLLENILFSKNLCKNSVQMLIRRTAGHIFLCLDEIPDQVDEPIIVRTSTSILSQEAYYY